MKKSIICLSFIILFSLFSCEKDEDSEMGGMDLEEVMELLEAHPWRIDYQLLNEEKCEILTNEDDPYIISFLEGGAMESVNFTEWSKDEEWEISGGKLLIDGTPFSIETLTSTRLVISGSENGISHSFAFVEEGNTESFPMNIIGKTYRFVSGKYSGGIDGEETPLVRTDGHDFTHKVMIDQNIMTVTDTKLYHVSWNAVSDSFIFIEGEGSDIFDNEDNVGYDLSLENNGDLTLRYYLLEDGGLKSSETFCVEATAVFRECNTWDYLDGPDWVLWEVERNGVVVTDNQPMPLGTIWFFNSFTQMVEERASASETEIDYLPWEFKETPTEENIRVDIEVEPDNIKTFKVMKGNIAELELFVVVEEEEYTLKFKVMPV